MKKVLLFLFAFVFATDSFANDIAANVTNPVCDNDTLSQYNGTANVEIDWVPNTIALRWYSDDVQLNVPVESQSCVYDGAMVIPPQPTKTGYTFKGWTVMDVPGNCTKIEYIESNGNQYIDTGFSAPYGFKAQIGFSFSNYYVYVIGAHNPSEPYGRNYLEIYTGGYIEIGASGLCRTSDRLQANTKYDLEFSTVVNNVYIKDHNDMWCTGVDSVRSSYSLYLFVQHGYGGDSKMAGRIYYAKIYDPQNILVRDFVPVLDPNGVACMYDKITGNFFYNIGTGSFVAGPVVQ